MDNHKNMGLPAFECPPGLPFSASCPSEMYRVQGQKAIMGTCDLWTDGLLCAYEFVPALKSKFKLGGVFGQKSGPMQGKFNAEVTVQESQNFELGAPGQDHFGRHLEENPVRNSEDLLENTEERNGRSPHLGHGHIEELRTRQGNTQDLDADLVPGHAWEQTRRKEKGSHWVPIGWARLSELVQTVQVDAEWQIEEPPSENDDTLSVADLATPYWQSRAGPTWWCHVDARHPHILAWLANANWLHPAISAALRDENRLISDRMKYLFYEVPVRVAGGLLFELLGQSVGDHNEDVPVVLRAWQAQNFLVTSMHVKGFIRNLNVLGVMEVQDLVGAGGTEAPKSVHEVIAQLAGSLASWDNRLFRKNYFGAADEVELKFVNRRANEDLTLLSIILNQEIRRLATQVIRVKWSLHAREEIVHELSTHLKGKDTLRILDRVRQSTRDMLDEQEGARNRLFTVQDVMQSNVRAWLQEKSIRVQHNLAVIGGGGLLLSVLVGLFGINVDGIPGQKNSPYAFAIFSACLVLLGVAVIGLGVVYLGMKKPPTEEQVTSRKIELQEFVKTFQRAAEAHENVRNLSSNDEEDVALNTSLDRDYILMA